MTTTLYEFRNGGETLAFRNTDEATALDVAGRYADKAGHAIDVFRVLNGQALHVRSVFPTDKNTETHGRLEIH